MSAADVWGGGGLELKWISGGKGRSKKVFSGFSGGGSLAMANSHEILSDITRQHP
jgi:hypothetical protein